MFGLSYFLGNILVTNGPMVGPKVTSNKQNLPGIVICKTPVQSSKDEVAVDLPLTMQKCAARDVHVLYSIYHLVMTNIAKENHHVQ